MRREDFDSDLFVGRGTLLTQLERWADEFNPTHRLWSVTGAPGTGKSWVLAAAYEKLKQDPSRPVFWIDMSKGEDGTTSQDFSKEADRANWLHLAVTSAQRQFSTIRQYDHSIPFEAMLDAFLRDLCDPKNMMRAPVFFVDGFEEMDQQSRVEIEERMLLRLFGSTSARLVIALRDEFSIKSPGLRWNENRLHIGPLSTDEGKSQLEKRASKIQYMIPNLGSLLKSIPPYQWNHPYANVWLSERATNNRQVNVERFLLTTDLEECLDELAKPQPLATNTFECLVALAHLRAPRPDQFLDTWMDLDMFSQLGIRSNSSDIEQLFEIGFITTIPKGPTKKVADGVRELARAWKRLNEEESQA